MQDVVMKLANSHLTKALQEMDYSGEQRLFAPRRVGMLRETAHTDKKRKQDSMRMIQGIKIQAGFK
jgi:hypothetical protein